MKSISRNYFLVAVLTIIVSFCSIVYELIYSQALTVMYGGTVTRYSITIGLYILSLGFGTFLYSAVRTKGGNAFFWWNELLLSIIGPAGVCFIFFLNTSVLSFDILPSKIVLTISHVPILVVGLLSGFEIPMLVNLLSSNEKNRFSKILGIDYIGSFLGTVVYSLVLYPRLGLIATAIGVGFLNFTTTMIYCFWRLKERTILKIFGVILLLLYFVALFYSQGIQSWVSDAYRTQEIKMRFNITRSGVQPRVETIKIEESFSTPYQDVILYEMFWDDGFYDKCLNLDSHIQVCGSTIESYHSGLVDIPMLFFRNENVRVLMIGGGDWFGIRHLLHHRNVALIDHVDIDQRFFDFAKKHPFFSKKHQHPYRDTRVHTFAEDALLFLKQSQKEYDLILIDIPGVGHDKLAHLYSMEFYGFILNRLSEKGIVATWGYSVKKNRSHYEVIMNTFREAGFKHHLVYSTYVKEKGRRLSWVETFYLLSANRDRKPDDEFPDTDYFRLTKHLYSDMSWIEIPVFPGIRPNSLLRPNYDVIAH